MRPEHSLVESPRDQPYANGIAAGFGLLYEAEHFLRRDS